MRKVLLLALFLTSATIFAQGTLTGTVIDSDMNGPLPGANVMILGTNNGTVTDFDGKFTLNVDKSSGKLEVSFVGYKTKTVQFNISAATKDMGNIVLSPDNSALDEIVVTGFSLAIDRKTPVAVSTIRTKEIETKLGNQEFPEILKTTPGVYVTKSGGGFGDAEMRLRGFESENIAVMINGVPVNDMENGHVYWSNWAGLADVTRSMQVQRGLGASKVAVPSVGGTINIVTKTTDAEKGGNVVAQTGNDGLEKFGATVSTGKTENGWAATVSASQTTGKRFVDGLEFEGYSYFLNIAKDISDNQQLSFTIFGAPQRHGQRETQYSVEDYEKSDRGIKFNGDWGYLNGQVVHVQDNFYHKPEISLNHYWDISDKTSLSTAAYVSFGTGGGGGYEGAADLRSVDSPYRSAPYQPLNLDMVVDENAANGADGSKTILYDSHNDHQWYGLLSTLSTDITDEITFLGGVDLRYYQGNHYHELKDLLGGQYYSDGSNVNDPLNLARHNDKIDYWNKNQVLWEGLFAQAEYSKNDLSAFLSVAASNTGYQRKDFFNYLDSDPNQSTDFVNFFGYSAKGGANYNISNSSNIFANIGYFEKAPFSNAVFLNFQNDVNPNAKNEKIFSAEVGYGYRTTKLRANINVYRTQWNDKTFIKSIPVQGGTALVANILGVNSLHQGVELDFDYKPFQRLSITGMASFGDWKWNNNIKDVQVYDENQKPVGAPFSVYIDGVPVGNSAQTTMALGADFEVLPGTTIRGQFTYYDRFYADFDPVSRTQPDLPNPQRIPDYGLIDLGLTHNFQFGPFEARLNANVFNLLDTEYIADANGGYNSVWYGFGRTFTVGTKINF